MAEKRRRFDAEFHEGTVRIVAETGRSAAEVARELGINETTLATRVSPARKASGDGTLGESEREELARLQRQATEQARCVRELEMERDRVITRLAGVAPVSPRTC